MNYRLSSITLAMLISAQTVLPAEVQVDISPRGTIQTPFIADSNASHPSCIKRILKTGGFLLLLIGVTVGIGELTAWQLNKSAEKTHPTPSPCYPQKWVTVLQARADGCNATLCSHGFAICDSCFPNNSSFNAIEAQLRAKCPGESKIEITEAHIGFCKNDPIPVCNPFPTVLDEFNITCKSAPALVMQTLATPYQELQKRYRARCADLRKRRIGH